jgi:hypothetical protein
VKPIRHINQLGTRVREQGRLRMGVKTGNAMKSLRHWRFTSPEEEPLKQLAVLYGGEVKPWSDAKAGQGANQFELLSTSSKIRVFIPPGGLSTWYEEWAGGGIKRRCDGETVFLDGDDQTTAPCICDAKQQMACKPKTRLSVVLPEITPFGGVWRLDTGSWNAADEMSAMEKMLDQLQIDGLVEAQLLIEERQKMTKGKKSKFVVPVILISTSAQGALEAPGTGALLAGSPVLELPAPTVALDSVTDDMEVVDAQIIDLPGYDRTLMDDRLTLAIDMIVQRYEYKLEDVESAFALGGSDGNNVKIASLSDKEHLKVVTAAEAIAQGRKTIVNISNGRLVLR